MELVEARKQFVAAWGSFGSNWGINRTMAQIHALLMVTTKPLAADEIMQELTISRGNANMNIRELINWGLVERVVVSGERREFFAAEKDIWKVARIIVRERKKRELEPMMRFLESISAVEGAEADVATFEKTISDIRRFGQQADQAMETMLKADENWLLGTLLKLMR
ncbi:MAG: transcriptional regulator [Chitinophagaceae bacterium]|jgi:DNA-binding transcriptional regulator GbsR (MarR family)|nr:transcriptional regulator [Chitinophagaceae bacterium]